MLPLEKKGRVDPDFKKVCGHSQSIYDLQWDPFNDNIIASASEDTTVKIWEIPDGGLKENLVDPLVTLSGHEKKVCIVRWHPSAHNVIASACFGGVIIVWNIETASEISVIDSVHSDVIWSMQWNWLGDKLLTTCKDRKTRIIDARSGKVLSENKCHDGSKLQQASFCGQFPYIITTGFTKMSARQYAVWSADDLTNELGKEEIDNNNSSLLIHYDEDVNMFYLVGKGDSVIRYYEVTSESPYVYWLASYSSDKPQKGCGAMPKRGCDTNVNEICRMYKIHNTQNVIEPVSFRVPRKSDQYQADIYPDTRGDEGSMTAEEWKDGKNTPPKLINLQGGFQVKKKGAGPGIKVKLPTKSSAGGQEMSAEELFATVKTLKEQVASLEKRVAQLEAK